MPSFDLIVFDIDGTLCHLRPVKTTFEAWEKAVVEEHPGPLPEALLEVPQILAANPRAMRCLVTSRHERIRMATARFLQKYFEGLGFSPLSMQTERQYEAWQKMGTGICQGIEWSRRGKFDRLVGIRSIYPGKMLLIDDDPQMAACCFDGDEFRRAW